MTDSMRVAIIGGGIAGLAAAYRLRQEAPNAAITLIERANRLGGKIVTDRVDGFVIEGGPDAFISAKPRGIGLCRELGLEPRLHGTNTGTHRTYVMRGGRLHPIPEGLTGLVPTRVMPMLTTRLLSPHGKLRMGMEYFIPRRAGDADETLAAFVSRRLGWEAYARMIDPLLSGIYAGDGAALSLQATFPQLRRTEIEHGGLIRGMRAGKRRAAATGAATRQLRSPFLTPETGLAEIAETLVARLEAAETLLNTPITAIRPAESGYLLHRADAPPLHADAVIVATPAYDAADMLNDLDPALAHLLRSIPYVSTTTISVAYRLADIPRPLDGHGYVVPATERRPVLACTWTSTKFPHRAPAGYALIRAFLGRAGQQEMLAGSDDDLLRLVRAELREVLGITAPPMLHRVFRWPAAMPQYTLGHLDRLASIEERLAEHPGLFVAGNAYRGVGIPDCIASGEEAAMRVLRHTPARVPALA